MRALALLYRSGLSRESVAQAIEQTTHSVRNYERGTRFPAKKPFADLVRLAESRGMTLLARDFIDDSDKCETDS